MKLFFAISLFVLISNAFADFPFVVANIRGLSKAGSFEVSHMPPIKDQGQIGLCYGFSSTALLENFRCRELGVNCHDKSQLISTLDVTSYFLSFNSSIPRALRAGGVTQFVLSNILEQDAKLASDKCINYSSFGKPAGLFDSPRFIEKNGWDYLNAKWNEYNQNKLKNVSICVNCMADDIKKYLKKMKTPVGQIEDALVNSHSVEEFLFKAIIPNECFDDNKSITLPSFEVKSFPTTAEEKGPEKLAKKIESILLNNIPLEISIRMISGGEFGGHSIVLAGIKRFCKAPGEGCKTLVKVQNSWGELWQDYNNDGWVDLVPLTQVVLAEFNSIVWLQKPGITLEDKQLK